MHFQNLCSIKANWAIVKVTYCGFCGSNYNLIQLHDSPMASPFTSFPCVIGYEVCATIEEPGDTGLKKGQRVVVNTMLSCVVRQQPLLQACKNGRPAHRAQLFVVPATISDKAAVLTEPLSVALQAIYDNKPQNSDRICIIGWGVMGLMLIRALRALNIRSTIAIMEPSLFHREKALEYGANTVIDNETQIVELTKGKIYKPMMGPHIMQGGFDKVFDTVGSTKTFAKAINITRAGGTVSLVGITAKLSFDPTPLWLKLITVKGVYGYGYVKEAGKQKHIFEKAIELMKKFLILNLW